MIWGGESRLLMQATPQNKQCLPEFDDDFMPAVGCLDGGVFDDDDFAADEAAARDFAGDDCIFANLNKDTASHNLLLPADCKASPASSSSSDRKTPKTNEQASEAVQETALADDTTGFADDERVQKEEASKTKTDRREAAGEWAAPLYRQRKKAWQIRTWHMDPDRRRHSSWGSSHKCWR